MHQYQLLCQSHYPFAERFASLADPTRFHYPGSQDALLSHLETFFSDCRSLDARIAQCPSLQNHTLLYFTQSSRYLHPSIRCEVRHLAGSIFTHVLFFSSLQKKEEAAQTSYDSDLLLRIKAECRRICESVRSPGWIWLCRAGQNHDLRLLFSRDYDIPDLQLYHPVLAIDVWEHSYFCDYPNRLLNYIHAYFDCADLPSLLSETPPLTMEKEA